jgi:hypothetical protein
MTRDNRTIKIDLILNDFLSEIEFSTSIDFMTLSTKKNISLLKILVHKYIENIQKNTKEYFLFFNFFGI